ncbi:MAG: CDP-alcohol phosphatidyltransferase family protein [Balneolaceae bacterium]|nr:CDP-alcohol phosphatidyltransferase family protein [Balneolaceae bacterium]
MAETVEKASGTPSKIKVRHLVCTWSNAISASRTLIALPIIYLHYTSGYQITWPIVVLVVYGIFSDYLDGIIARKTNQVSELGKVLDPIADKLTALLLFIYTVYIEYIPLWFFILEIGRDVLILSGSIYIKLKRGKVPMAVTSGKFAVNGLAAYWMSVFFFPEATGFHLFFMGNAIALMVFSFFDYLQRLNEILHGAEFN